MSLLDTKKDCLRQASVLPKSYMDYTIDALANGYCDAIDTNDATLKSIYMSALVLRFWFQINKIYLATKDLGYDRDDAFYRVWECIEAACYYRAWQDPNKHTNAQACINQVIASRGIPAMVGEANFQKNTRGSMSLDTPISNEGESTFGDTLADDYAIVEDGAKEIVQALLSANKVVEAIIADKISYSDPFKHVKKTIKKNINGKEYKYVEHSSSFWPFRVVQELNSIDEAYKKYFTKSYTINTTLLDRALETLRKANNTKKYKIISKSLETMKVYI